MAVLIFSTEELMMSTARKFDSRESIPNGPLPLPSKEEAASFAVANAAIEGLTVSLGTQEMLTKWAAGAITDDELLSFSANGFTGSLNVTNGR